MALAREYMHGNDVSHDMAHVCRVVKNAKLILKNSEYPEIDQDVLVLIAALHDCTDRKYVTPENLPGRISELKNRIQDLGFSAKTADFVLSTIENISFTKEKQGGEAATSDDQYLAIAPDADRLDAIGAIGVARCFAYSAAVGRPLATENFAAEIRAKNGNSGNNESAILHFYEKLIFLKNRFRTPAGLKMAEKRHEFLQIFLAQIHEELE